MRRDRNQPRARRLSADEHGLWKEVTGAIKPLKPRPAIESPVPRESDPPDEHAAPAPGIAAPAKMPAAPPLVPLDRRLRQRLAKGSERIDRRLDLHGLTQREAHDALGRFLRAAQAEGAKVVLVVTGKGGRAADRDPVVERGVLRRLVPQWLHAPEFRNLVVGFDAAHVGHGGAGALYVRLRRRRA
jgi:DNA-nicking Smr family endonuclease